MTHDLLSTATETIEAAVSESSLGEEVWWSLAPTIVPSQQGPQAMYVLMLHLKSPMIGSTLSHIALFDNPIDLVHAEALRPRIASLVAGLLEERTSLLSSPLKV